jgi:hypothetical protein
MRFYIPSLFPLHRHHHRHPAQILLTRGMEGDDGTVKELTGIDTLALTFALTLTLMLVLALTLAITKEQ